jgi:hypothetical protein
MIPRVRGVNTAAIVSAVMFWDTGSTSAITGTPPRMITQLAEAINVRLVVITSSPVACFRQCKR